MKSDDYFKLLYKSILAVISSEKYQSLKLTAAPYLWAAKRKLIVNLDTPGCIASTALSISVEIIQCPNPEENKKGLIKLELSEAQHYSKIFEYTEQQSAEYSILEEVATQMDKLVALNDLSKEIFHFIKQAVEAQRDAYTLAESSTKNCVLDVNIYGDSLFTRISFWVSPGPTVIDPNEMLLIEVSSTNSTEKLFKLDTRLKFRSISTTSTLSCNLEDARKFFAKHTALSRLQKEIDSFFNTWEQESLTP